MRNNRWLILLLLCVLAVFAIGYLTNLDGWLMDDDEGAAFYEVWQFQVGQQPGNTFIAENQPLFLWAGKLIIDSQGRNPAALRLLSALTVLAGTLTLAVTVARLWSIPTAVLTAGLILTNGLVFDQARIFRPDGIMFGWELVGLSAVLLAVARKRPFWWSIAGLCYGIAVLWKLFGLLPVLGLVFYFLWWLWRERADWKPIIQAGIPFSIPFLLISLGGSFLLYNSTGFYYAEAFSYHAGMEAGINFFMRLGRNMLVFLLFFWPGLIYLFILPLWFINRHQPWHWPQIRQVLLAQLATLVVFAFVSRPLHIRYFLYLVPVLALLLAWQIHRFFKEIANEYPKAAVWETAVSLIIVTTAILISQPNMVTYITRQETDTVALADFVASQTEPETAVLSDYATINFLADRPSVYEASIIAGGQIQSGAVTGERLIHSIEERDVQMVLIHVAGGDPFPHQLVNLIDYDAFRAYVTDNFELLTVFDRNEQLIEVYKRPLSHEP